MSSALSKSHHRVLHLDSAGDYGSSLASLHLASFKEFLAAHQAPLTDDTPTAPTEDQLREWRQAANDTTSEFEYEPVTMTRIFYDAHFDDFTEPTTAASNSSSSSDADLADAVPSPASESAPPAAAAAVVPSLMSESRRFLVDLTPHLLFSRSPLIDVFVEAGIDNYVEFKAVDNAYFASGVSTAAVSADAASVAAAPSFAPLPLSKSAIFQTSSMSMLEKRLLMKFMHLILGDDYHQATSAVEKQSAAITELTQDPQQSFLDFLRTQKLSNPLIHMILYAVALVDESLTAAGRVRVGVGIARLRSYLSSVGRYGPGAFLYPYCGTSELPQAFVHMCAVHNGIYILRFKPEAIVYRRGTSAAAEEEKREYRGIITQAKQFITSNALVAETEYLPPAVDAEFTYVSRCVLFLDGPLVSLESLSAFSLASKTPEESPIYGLQLGADVGATPRGRTIAYLWTSATSVEDARTNAERLRSLVHGLTRSMATSSSEASNDQRPRLLGLATYQQRAPCQTPLPPMTQTNAATIAADAAPVAAVVASETAELTTEAAATAAAAEEESTPARAASPLPRMVLTVAPPAASLAFGLDACLVLAREHFARLCPHADFLATLRRARQEPQYDQDLALLQQMEGNSVESEREEDEEKESHEEEQQLPTASEPAESPAAASAEQTGSPVAEQEQEATPQAEASAVE